MNAHTWAEVFEWLDDPGDAASLSARSLRATCVLTTVGFDTAVHTGGILLAAHRRDAPLDDEATCRWAQGWWPVSVAECTALDAAAVVLRLEQRVLTVVGFQQLDTPCKVVCTATRLPDGDAGAVTSLGPLCTCRGRLTFHSSSSSSARSRSALVDPVTGSWAISPHRWRRLEAVVMDLAGLSHVRCVGERFFANCPLLQKINPGALAALETAGGSFLAECPALTDVSFVGAARLTSIGDSLLREADSLTHVRLDGLTALTSIGGRAFGDCWALQSLSFAGCPALTSLAPPFAPWCQALRHLDIASSGMRLRDVGEDFGSHSQLPRFNPGGAFSEMAALPAHFFARSQLREASGRGFGSVQYVGDSTWRGSAIRRFDSRGLDRVVALGAHVLDRCLHLEFVDLSGFSSVRTVGSDFLGHAASLVACDLRPMTSLTRVGPRCLGDGAQLHAIDMRGLSSLRVIDEGFASSCPWLSTVRVDGVTGLTAAHEDTFRACPRLMRRDARVRFPSPALLAVGFPGQPPRRKNGRSRLK